MGKYLFSLATILAVMKNKFLRNNNLVHSMTRSVYGPAEIRNALFEWESNLREVLL